MRKRTTAITLAVERTIHSSNKKIPTPKTPVYTYIQASADFEEEDYDAVGTSIHLHLLLHRFMASDTSL
jgi:hypothetical protein